jgi:polar amino acid transport system substrate-binding protein
MPDRPPEALDFMEAGRWRGPCTLLDCFARRILIAWLLAVMAGGTLVSAPLVIAVEDDAAPWSQRDGTGFANDTVRAAFKAVNVEVDLSVVPYARGKDMVVKGKLAVCFSMSWVPELAGKVVFSEKPLFTFHDEYFVRSESTLKATKEAELPKGTVVGIVIGYEYPPSVYALKEKGIIIFEESETEESNLKKLAKGRIDAALVNFNETKPVELAIARAGVAGQVKHAFPSGDLGAFVGFSTKHPQGMKAREQFNEGYRIISTNGTLGRIEREWRERALKEVARLSDKPKQ